MPVSTYNSNVDWPRGNRGNNSLMISQWMPNHYNNGFVSPFTEEQWPEDCYSDCHLMIKTLGGMWDALHLACLLPTLHIPHPPIFTA